MMHLRRALVIAMLVGCGGGDKDKPEHKDNGSGSAKTESRKPVLDAAPPAVDAAVAPPAVDAAPAAAGSGSGSGSGSATKTADVPPGEPPADGKYEKTKIDGTAVPMINVMNKGTVILVDTDGKKPRTWEEQYKRSSDKLPKGHYDEHKSDANHNGKFDDDKVDTGLWVIDKSGNITKH